jgi:hypothetical protein
MKYDESNAGQGDVLADSFCRDEDALKVLLSAQSLFIAYRTIFST